MLSITVKTLDSQNHVFSVDDDMTVRQFKEQIAEKTNIAVDSQRLIYCGRVLVDEKLLREYDVNGKVVHLVQRAPPSSRPNHSNRSSNSDSNTNGSGVNVRGAPIFRAIDGMVLGAMAIPVNANNGTPQAAAPSLNPSSTLCMNRITVARYMLECANNIAAYLEDPSRGLNNTAMDILAQQTMESTVLEVGISAVSDVEIPQHQMQNLVQAFQGAVSAAFRQNGISNIRVMQQGNEPNNVQMFASDEQSITGGSGGSTATTSTSAPIAASTAVTSQNPDGTSTQGSSIGATARAPSASSSTSSATRVATENLGPVSTTPNGRQQTTSTQTLAEVVQQMRNVQVRLEPFIQQYYDILLNDPTYDETNSVQRESSQRVYDRVSEALHYMSHAQHAISDLMLDLSTNVPRHLCCRPILVEQSAFVSSGIALPNPVIPLAQVIRPPGLNGNNNETSGNFNNNNQVTGQSTAGGIPPNIGPQQQRQQTGVSGLGQPNFMQQVAIIESDLNNGQSEIVLNLSNRFQQHHNQLDNLGDNVEEEFITTDVTNEDNRGGVGSPPPVQVARLIQAVMNSAPLHADVHVEINNMSSSPQTPTTNNTTDTANNANGDTNPPQQAPQTQPRVTTATHPTTSTQTRSTSRPQVHLTNLQDTPVRNYLRPVPANMLSAFDRFLPCNSHHIRDNLPSEQQQQQGMPIGVTLRNRTSQRPMERITISRPTRTQSDSRLENQRLNNNSGVASSLLNEFSNLGVIYNIPIRIFGDQLLSIRELLNATPTILNGIRQGFLSHIQTTFFNGSTITDENMAGGVNEGLNLLEIYLQPLSQMDLPDYDARRSIENIIRDFLPSIFVLIRDDDSAGFGTRLLRTTNIFFKRLVTILVTCIGHANLLSYCTQVMQTAMSSNILVESQRNLLMSLINRYIDQMTTDLSEVREFIVIRRPAPGENIENLVGAASSNQIQPMDTDDTEEPRPMVVDHEEVVLSVANREQLVQPPTIEDDETLPSVVIGSEPWHVNFPTSSWIPVITRDIGRQRRQNSQAPFSDAYISGMSSKRRKIISDNKPASDVPNMLSEGIRRAIHTAGVSTSSSSPPVDEIATAISTDPIVQTSYKEALKANIQDRLQNDPDFNSERFPSSSKFYNNK